MFPDDESLEVDVKDLATGHHDLLEGLESLGRAHDALGHFICLLGHVELHLRVRLYIHLHDEQRDVTGEVDGEPRMALAGEGLCGADKRSILLILSPVILAHEHNRGMNDSEDSLELILTYLRHWLHRF